MKFAAHFTALLLLSSSAFAGEPALQPTVVSAGECVPPTISTARTSFQIHLDQAGCDARNSDDEQKRKACRQHSRQEKTLAFFAVDCNADDGVLLSMNGIEHKLHFADAKLAQYVSLDGHYQGDGFDVKVKSGRVIRRTYDTGVPHAKDNFMNEWVDVTVAVTYEGKTQKIYGVARYGP